MTAVGIWQGVTIGVAALVYGVPLGLVVGRWFWSRLADRFGTRAESVVPLAALLALAEAVVLLAAIAGLALIRAGLRHPPATVLRDE